MIDFRKNDSDGKPNQIDVYVGNRLRMQRTLMGMSQAELGEALGLTFQQIQKYEQGNNRIGSSRLYDLSTILNVSITYFFDNMEESIQENKQVENNPNLRSDPAAKRETLELVRAFTKIDDISIRASILDIINSLNHKF